MFCPGFQETKIGEQRFFAGRHPFFGRNVTFLLIIFLIEEAFIFLQTKF